MHATTDPTELLLDRIAGGDTAAVDLLLGRYRPRLRSLVSLRLDPRIAGRVDASDVVQDALAKASRRIMDYVRDRPLPFYPWLRRLAIDRIVEVHRAHIHARRRSVTCELAAEAPVSSNGRSTLVRELMSLGKSPSESARFHEEVARAHAAVEELSEADREVLVLRYLEQLTPGEAAAILGITANTFAQRHLRALRRVRAILADDGGADEI